MHLDNIDPNVRIGRNNQLGAIAMKKHIANVLDNNRFFNDNIVEPSNRLITTNIY